MKTNISIYLVPVLITLLSLFMAKTRWAGAQSADEPGTVSVPAAGDEEPVLVGTLRGRAFAVHLFTGERYSIEDHSGELVGVHLSAEEFADQFPDIYDATQDMFASEPIADHFPRGDSFPLDFRAGPDR